MSNPMELNKNTSADTRDNRGLMNNEHIEYKFNEDGSIDWRAMVSEKYLYPNRQWFESREKTVPTSIEGLKDNQLLIMIGGLKELAQVRGYSSVSYQVYTAEPDFVTVSCQIDWLPNYETQGKPIQFQSLSCASVSNTDGFARYYLPEIAENRAFTRCVRNFLKINIVGQDEVARTPQELSKTAETIDVTKKSVVSDQFENRANVHYMLEKLMRDKDISFEQVKKKCISMKVDGAENFEGLHNIPNITVYELTTALQKYKPKEG